MAEKLTTVKATKKGGKTVESAVDSTAKAKAGSANTTPLGTPAGLFGIAPYTLKPNEEYMSDAQLEHFKQVLYAWRDEIMQEVDKTVLHMKDESAALADINDRATQEEEFAIELRTRDRERKLLKKIEETLKNIDDGDYGYCEGCGVEIGLRRLEARPTATLCIDCKSLAEIKEKQEKGGM